VQASTKAIATALVALAAYAPIAAADGDSATRRAPSLPAVAAPVAATDGGARGRTSARVTSAGEAAAERRCRSTAGRRFARVRRASPTKRERTAARKRVRRKLRRCLGAARRVVPAPPTGGVPVTPRQPSSPAPGPAPPGPTLPSFVGVTASDDDGFRLTLSRPAVAAGNVTIELRNTDSGPHDLVVEPDGGGAEVARLDPVGPGSPPLRKAVSLPAGRWRLYCSLSNHALAGMQVTLRAE
jgi:hypothetical protein